MTQNDAILEWLQAGNSITQLDALRRFGCLRLSGRVYDLKARGHDIRKEMIPVGGKWIARYRLSL